MSTGGRVRLAVLDDNPFLRTPEGTVHPAAATFHRFAEAVVRAGPFGQARYLIPVRQLRSGEPAPGLGPVDQTVLRIEATTPYAGAADYLRRAPSLTRANWPVLRRAIARSDLIWIKTPASNALLAAIAARVAGARRFAYVAGSSREVVSSQNRRGLERMAATGAAGLYDAVTTVLTRTGPAVHLDAELFTSVVERRDLDATPAEPPARQGRPWRVVWAGRMAGEKGLPELVEAVELLARERPVELLLIGDGPARALVDEEVARRGLDGRVRFLGYLGDRTRYFQALREGDLFVLPSAAEGVPKVVVEAMAAGVPVVARSVGRTADVLGRGERGVLVQEPGARPLAQAMARLLADEGERRALRRAALAWAAGRTAEAQARRLVAWMTAAFPELPWPDESRSGEEGAQNARPASSSR